METNRKSDETLLNALVDGELTPTEHAAAAARLRKDRDFARAYATLTKLKAGVVEVAEDVEVPLIEVPRKSPHFRWAKIGAAASLAVLFAVTALSFGPSLYKQTIQTETATEFVSFAGDPVIPDLSPAGLQLARTVVRASHAIVAIYVGPRGCRLELWVSNASSSTSAPRGSERRSWRVGGLIYELVAFGMPAERFHRVAEAAESATRATILPEGLDQRLIEARVSAAPCVA